MNHNDRALAGLAWLAATMPTLVQQDCLKGDEIVGLTTGPHNVDIHLDDYATTARVAARFGFNILDGFGGPDNTQTWWGGKSGEIEVRVMTCDPAPTSTVSTYECERCGAAFGIAGCSTGSDEDREADEYFDEQIAHHESGACVPVQAEAVTA